MWQKFANCGEGNMKRIVFLTLVCLVVIVAQVHAAFITESEDNDSLGKADTINTITNFINDPNFTKNGSLQSYSAVVQGNYADRDYDYFQLTVGGDFNAVFNLHGFTNKKGNATGQLGSLGLWQQLSDNSWKSWGVMSSNAGSDLSWEALLTKGTWVVGVAGNNAKVGASGFSKGAMNGGDYQLDITVANPEPSAFLLTGLGLLGLFGARKKLSRSKIGSA
jgi:hypothetical protein